MKMIWHQCIRQKVAMRNDIEPHLPEKPKIISLVKEDTLAIIAAVVNVVKIACRELHNKTGVPTEQVSHTSRCGTPRLHIPSILPAYFKKRLRNLPEATPLHSLHQLFEDIASVDSHALQCLQGFCAALSAAGMYKLHVSYLRFLFFGCRADDLAGRYRRR